MSLRSNIPDPDGMNEQRAAWAEVALLEFASEVSGPQSLADTRELDNVAASFLCDSSALLRLCEPGSRKHRRLPGPFLSL
jgi:hypothetical protein